MIKALPRLRQSGIVSSVTKETEFPKGLAVGQTLKGGARLAGPEAKNKCGRR